MLFDIMPKGRLTMNSTPQIFKERLIQNRLSHYSRTNIPDFEAKFKEVGLWCNATAEQHLDRTKETTVQGAFMTRLFNQVFGYLEVVDDTDCYNQERESKTILDTTESDGALGFFYKTTGKKDVRVVIELKDARTSLDKKQNRSNHLTPVEQAFSYANKNGSKCAWVIVSNFVETRLYRSTSSLEYETFDMRKMKDEKEFLRFYYFLCKDHLLSETGRSLLDELYQENEAEGIDITNQFYYTYKEIRNKLFTCLKENNPGRDDLFLFTKSQKLMDRFTFICFCEDCDLLPQNIYRKLIETAKQSFSSSPNKLWEQLRGLFASIDRGNPPMKINQYNGGLFKEDPELDSLIIPDEILESFTQLSDYDFNSDLNVNILGQIFEQSITDVEQIKKEISGTDTEDDTGKKKEDGIFYTPYYVTRYIVEQTVGVYLAEKKEELKRTLFSNGAISIAVLKDSTNRKHEFKFTKWTDLPELKENMSEEETMFRKAVEGLHLRYWNAYEDILREIKICDPACGSGAFLNQCFDFLHEEMDFVLGMKAQFEEPSLFDIDKQILQHNLFGVDINPESVEITKLSLWLKTAKNNQTLATLDENIKCGNSIIGDKSVVENAFIWEKEFPTVFGNGGFDIIVGNPPYGARLNQAQKAYITEKYITTEFNFDTYKTFFELGMNITKNDGFLGFITPNTYFSLELGANRLRKFLFNNVLCRIVEVFNVFPSAIVEPAISIYRKRTPTNEEFISICLPRRVKPSSTFLNEGIESKYTQSDLRKNDQLIFNYRSSKQDQQLCLRMERFPRLDTMFDVMTGAKPYQVGKGTPPQTKGTVKSKPFTGVQKKDESWLPYIRGRCIERYTNLWERNKEYIQYGEWLAEPRSAIVFEGEKLFIRQTGDSLIATYDQGHVSNNTLHSIYPIDNNTPISLQYLLGLINSSLLNWYYKTVHFLEVGKPMAEVKGIFIKKLPIAIGNDDQVERIEAIVQNLLRCCQQRFAIKNRFVSYIIHVYNIDRVSDKIFNFDVLPFSDFCIELSKHKVKLSASSKMELLRLFEEYVGKVKSTTERIESLQQQLDNMVFSIYEIDTESATRILFESDLVI